jgi:hypothetical protein
MKDQHVIYQRNVLHWSRFYFRVWRTRVNAMKKPMEMTSWHLFPEWVWWLNEFAQHMSSGSSSLVVIAVQAQETTPQKEIDALIECCKA